MTVFLQRQFIIVARSDYRRLRIEFVRAGNIFCSRHRDAVIPTRATFGQHQIIITVAFVNIRPFGEDFFRKEFRHRSDEFARLVIVFLNDNSRKAIPVFAKIPNHVQQPLAPVVIVKERRVETDGIEFNRVAPRAKNFRRGREENFNVLKIRQALADVCINQPELSVGKTQRRRPNAGGIHHAAQIELRCPRERVPDEPPVHQIF